MKRLDLNKPPKSDPITAQRMAEADLVVMNGKVIKDRYGVVGVPISKRILALHRALSS